MTGTDRRVVVVTGATGGIGRALTTALVGQGVIVVAVARDRHRLAQLNTGLDGPGRIDTIAADLSTASGIRECAATIGGRHPTLDALVNNAGAHFTERRTTADGLELHVAINFLAAFGLTHSLAGPLGKARGRVVIVASDTINDTRRVKLLPRPRPATLDLSDVRQLRDVNPPRGFSPFEAYARAKLMAVTAGYAFAERLASTGVTVNAVHPGLVNTDIVHDLVPPLMRPLEGVIRRALLAPQEGAAAVQRLVDDPQLAGVSGRYFVRSEAASTPPQSHDRAMRRRVWELGEAALAP